MHSAETDIALRQHVLKTLLYFDIFNYPLKDNEVFRFLGMNSITEEDVVSALTKLRDENILSQHNDLYSLQHSREVAERRLKGNIEAARCLKIAKRKANLISGFPFVRAVFASGSLSKDYMDDRSDLDFFVITAPKRLWIARTLLALYKRIFLLNSHKYFCINYFVDEEHLEIEEKNHFTATELATVLPLYGASHYIDLHQANPWVKSFFPNFELRSVSDILQSKSGVLKTCMESIINVLFPARLERYFRNVTLKRWKKMYEKDFQQADFQIAFKSKAYASKNHDKNYQRKIMNLYAEKLKLFDQVLNRQMEETVENGELKVEN